MPSLINNKETVRLYVRINYINDISSLPDFQLAAEKYLIPIIGQALYDDLLAQVIAFEVPAEGEEPVDIDDVDLVGKCRAVIAPLGYLMELATIHTQITDSGLRTASTETLQAAHRWEYNKVEEHLIEKGSFAIESLLKYLFKEKDDYTDWTDSDEYKDLSSIIFQIASEFNKYFRVQHPYRVWWELRPLIREVEDFYIIPTIGEDFYTELKEDADPGADEIKAIELIKKAVAQLTIVKAIEKLSVRITPNGFTILISAGNSDAANSGDHPQRDPQLSLLYESCERSGSAYLLQLQEYLNSKASDSVFQSYYESDKYEAPSTEPEVSPNANRKIFGL